MSNIEEPSEDDLFNDAVSDEATDNPVAAEEFVEQPEYSRDEAGRFAKAEQEQEVAAEEKPAVDDNAPHVPSWRVREINEEKRALADKVAALEAERANWVRPQSQAQPAERAVETKVERPDPLLDPEGYEKYLEQKVEARLLNDRREASLQAARDASPAEFDEAYKAAQQRIDPALKARMQVSRDPGKTLLEWHRETKQRAEIGDDLTAYKQRLREEALKDPEFRKAALEAWRSDAQPLMNNGRPRVDLPPSMNGASRSNAALRSSSGDPDISDQQLFEQIAG